MYISKIELMNYRPYYGNQTIKLGYNSKENFNVIYANNAIGKSSLLNAITWAFYGKELHDRKEKENPIYNKLIKNECEVGNTFQVKVKLELYDYINSDEKVHFQVERSKTYKKHEEGLPSIIEEELKVLDFDGEWKEDDQSIIDSNISKLMHKYFFFNGEQLNDYFDNEDIKKTVESISQLNLISTIETHLNRVHKIYEDESSKLDKDVEPVNLKISKITENLISLKKDKKKLNSDIIQLNDQINRFDEGLKDLEKSKKLALERDELIRNKALATSKLSQKNRVYNKKVAELFAILKLFDVLYEISLIKLNDPKKSQIPDYIRLQVYEEILNSGECICGVDLNTNPKRHTFLDEKINELKSSGNESNDLSNIHESIFEVKHLLKNLGEKYQEINDLRSDIYDIRQSITGKNGFDVKLKQISDEFTEGDDETISQLESLRKDTIEKCKSKNDDLEDILKNIGICEKAKDELIEKRDEILKDKENLKEITKRLKFCESAQKIVSNLDDNLKEDMLEQLRDKINKQFVDTNWSDGKYKEVIIDDNYKVSMKDYLNDTILPGDLSGGEERILALSFIMSLNSISGFDLPLFIDAPLSTLDELNSRNFMKNLHKFTTNKQIIFLFIGDKYNDNIESFIKPYLNKKIPLIKVQDYKTIVGD